MLATPGQNGRGTYDRTVYCSTPQDTYQSTDKVIIKCHLFSVTVNMLKTKTKQSWEKGKVTQTEVKSSFPFVFSSGSGKNCGKMGRRKTCLPQKWIIKTQGFLGHLKNGKGKISNYVSGLQEAEDTAEPPRIWSLPESWNSLIPVNWALQLTVHFIFL